MSLKKLNLKCEGIELWGNKRTFRRWHKTLNFVHKRVIGSRVLDIGGENIFGYKMAVKLGLDYYTTHGDLNETTWHTDGEYPYDNIFCFEVIEHLMNPALFLSRLCNYCDDKTLMFITYPTNPFWLWGDRHFNEYTKNRFYTMITECGYRIIYHEWNRAFRDWWTPFTGIRPMIRQWLRVFGLSRDNFYVIVKC